MGKNTPEGKKKESAVVRSSKAGSKDESVILVRVRKVPKLFMIKGRVLRVSSCW